MSGSLFIVSAPSGAGKTTLVRMLLESDPAVRLSVSHTTRAPRAGEVEGRDYHFVDVASFLAMRERGDFVESAQVHGNYYGTSRVWLEASVASGQDVLLEIDWQGAAQVRRLFPESVKVFVLPPSMAELERRLRGRGKDSDEVAEMEHLGEFDYAIINNELPVALEDLKAVVRASRLRYQVQRARLADRFKPGK
jgi:guanylate kinase